MKNNVVPKEQLTALTLLSRSTQIALDGHCRRLIVSAAGAITVQAES